MRVNIYINNEEHKQLEKISQKYKVSLSTIADILIQTTYYEMIHEGKDKTQDYNTQLQMEYILKNGFEKKTSCKPKCYNKGSLYAEQISKKDCYTTNVIKLYCTKEIEKYLTEEGKKCYYEKINKKFQETKEQFWNYNNFLRSTRRSLKENIAYYKKEIELIESGAKKQ